MNNLFKVIFITILFIFILVLGYFLYTNFNDTLTSPSSNSDMLTEEDAKMIATKELEKLGYNNQVIQSSKLTKTEGQNIWYFWTTNNEILIQINATSGKLKSFSNISFDDTKIESTYDKELATHIAHQIYQQLDYTDGEYELADLKMNVSNSSLWQADFCKKYDDVYNPYECIRIIFVPEINKLKSLIIFDYETENNSVNITKEEAIEIAKNSSKQNNIKEITSTLGFAKTDSLKARKAWIVEIEYHNDSFVDIHTYYIDTSTGNIISSTNT